MSGRRLDARSARRTRRAASARIIDARALARAVLVRCAVVAHVKSCTLVGIDAALVEVECAVARGLPEYVVVGLPATSVREGATRIRSAFKAVNRDIASKRVTVNLAPADLRKPGTGLDLPIAASVLIAQGEAADPAVLDRLLVVGELGLDGSVRAVRGVLAATMLARDLGLRGVVVPAACVAEASAVEELEIYGLAHVRELIAALACTADLPLGEARPRRARPRFTVDMAEVRGQALARLAIETAVAGGHNILLAGPPGTGKTMLARRIPTLLPAMTRAESLETTKIYSALGLADGLIEERPFRAPHHTISSAALLGGGSNPRPGEISLAHNGVLFLDELPEFQRGAIEGLRQPLEERDVVIGRIHHTIRCPASFLLVAAANPCPCGWRDSGIRECTCGPGAIERYRQRLSGPLLDRIDLQIFVDAVPLAQLRDARPAESSAAIRERVAAARERQHHRLRPWGLHCNAEMPPAVLRATCRLDDACERTLETLVGARQTLSARSVDRVIRVARTIADLLGQDDIDPACLHEAVNYRDVDPAARLRDVA